MHQPRVPHLRDALNVVKYLQGTKDHGLFYFAQINFNISTYSDSDEISGLMLLSINVNVA